MRQPSTSDRIRNARACVLAATRACASADLVHLERAILLLENAAREIHDVESGIISEAPQSHGQLRRETSLMKNEIDYLVRVIDGCSVVCRGLSLRFDGAAMVYTPLGHAVNAHAPVAAGGLQG